MDWTVLGAAVVMTASFLARINARTLEAYAIAAIVMWISIAAFYVGLVAMFIRFVMGETL